MTHIRLLPLTLLTFVVLAVNDVPSPAVESCDRSQPSFNLENGSSDDVNLGMQLLQFGLHMGRHAKMPTQAALSRSYLFPQLYWGLSSDRHPQEFRKHNTSEFKFWNMSGECSVDIPDNTHQLRATMAAEMGLFNWSEYLLLQQRGFATSGFSFGVCPTVLDAKKVRIDLRLDYQRDGLNSTGYNPSIVHLPSFLLAAFPRGQWLALVRAGGELPFACTWIRQKDKSEYRHINQGTFAVVLDGNMQVLAQSKVRVPDKEGMYDEAAIMDARLKILQNGDMVISYTPYELENNSPHKIGQGTSDSWWGRQVVTKLHIRGTPATGGQNVATLDTWVKKSELRYIAGCRSPGVHKNMGFFEVQGELYALDSILPLKVGKLNLSTPALPDDKGYIKKICFDSEIPAPLVNVNPYQGTVSQGKNFMGELSLHNGPSPIWIEELNIFLGVGHLRRAYEGVGLTRWSHHYTHQWFAISGSLPFSLVSMSPEFCFGSDEHPGDCEITQFASGLTRDGGNLVVGFGIMDCDAIFATLSLNETLKSLRRVD